MIHDNHTARAKKSKESKKKTPENTQLKPKALKDKYGKTKVGVVLTETVIGALPKKGFAPPHSCMCLDETRGIRVYTPLSLCVAMNLEYIPRWEAETDPEYLQPIAYSILTFGDRYFCTKRIGEEGDKRLSGLCSIGVGGHIDDCEGFTDSVYRELKEEVGLEGDNIFSKKLIGYIYDPSTEVSKVHLGIVYHIIIKNPERVAVQETNKLEGEWVTYRQLKTQAKAGQLESWSELLVLDQADLLQALVREPVRPNTYTSEGGYALL